MMGDGAGRGPGKTAMIATLENTTAQLITLQDLNERISEHSMAITALAQRGGRALDNGNLRLAAEIFADVERATLRQRELLARMQTVTEAARATLAARRGEYGTD